MDYSEGLLPIIDQLKDQLTANHYDKVFEQFVTTNDFKTLNDKLISDTERGIDIYPPPNDIFNALLLTPLNNIKMIIIGQDCYHTFGAAHGLAFSHPNSYHTIQPSLNNIYKEVEQNGYKVDWSSGNLTKWAQQGVLLLNTALTVQQGKAGSHLKIWEPFTVLLFNHIKQHVKHAVVMMWGKPAQRYDNLLKNYDLLIASHPSPLSAHISFNGCQHFTKANAILSRYHIEPIDWSLTN